MTRRGKRVAKIIPFASERKMRTKLALEKLRALQQEMDQKGLTLDEINAMKAEGRK